MSQMLQRSSTAQRLTLVTALMSLVILAAQPAGASTAVSTLRATSPPARVTPAASGWQLARVRAQVAGVALTGVSCTTSSVCVTVGDTTGGGSAVILASADGGMTWSGEPVPAGVSSLADVSCDVDSCMAVGSESTNGVAITSTDSGNDWAVVSSASGSMPPLTIVSCGQGTCFVGGGSFVLGSTDFGASWGDLGSGPSGLSAVEGISCLGTNACTVVGTNSTGGATEFEGGNGEHWQHLPIASPTVSGIGCVGTNGDNPRSFCIVPGTLGTDPVWGDVTVGDEWPWPEAGNGSYPVLTRASVSCPNDTDCLVAGAGGSMVTSDAGYRFRTGVVGDDATAVSCASPDDCVAVGPDGTIELSYTAFDGPSFPRPQGFRIAAADGGVFVSGIGNGSDGPAPFYGSLGGRHLNEPIVGIATDAATDGYWLVGADGGVFAFHAPFYGSTGAIHLNQPIVGIASTYDGRGYWLLGRDGGIFAFGDAKFYGSAVGRIGGGPAVAIAATNGPDGGYLVLAETGYIEFGTQLDEGCNTGKVPPDPVAIVSALPVVVDRGSGHCSYEPVAYAIGAAGQLAPLGAAVPEPQRAPVPVPVVALFASSEDEPYYQLWYAATQPTIFWPLGTSALDGYPYPPGITLAAPFVGMAPG
jgi:photosystem II stability/assembly factor-like uncharacterized protein